MRYTVDFETEAIGEYPNYPPRPVGVSIFNSSGEGQYYAWGHPVGNNCQFEHALFALGRIWKEHLVFHNAKFDLAVAKKWMGMPDKPVATFHDTMFLLYLDNPNRRKLALKECADEVLGIAPTERDEVKEWILRNVQGATDKRWRAHICKAPGDLVGKYANGDTHRTNALFEHLYERVVHDLDMEEAYLREKRLVNVLMDVERRGVRVDVERLAAHEAWWSNALLEAEKVIYGVIGQCDLDSNASLLHALRASGNVNDLLLKKTEKGADSVAKGSLEVAVSNVPLKNLLRYRNTLATLVTTFMRPWLQMAGANGGRLHPQYQQTKGEESGGTRTGRLSSNSPNLQNVPNVQEIPTPEGFLPLPVMREYLLPEEGHVWMCGDIRAQEPKLTAHFENGDFMAMYNQDPLADVYVYLMERVRQLTGVSVTRKQAKAIFLGLVYGMGSVKLAAGLGVSEQEAKVLKNATMAAMPDVVALIDECKGRFKCGLPIKTIGGRVVHCEPPTIKDGIRRSWEYKAINTLIQGSASDQTKEAVCYMADNSGNPILTTVHDEIDMSVPEHEVADTKMRMSKAINALPCDVPMTMEFMVGKNWAEASK